MLIKAADGREADILALEQLLDRTHLPQATRRRVEDEIRAINAGVKGEREAAYLIDLHLGRSPNWAVIHDLRIEVDGLAAQIDHLIINRLAQVWVCESKHFAEGVAVNEYGEWSRWWRGRQEGIPSPVEQNRRHILLLERAFDDGLVKAPKRLGLVRRKPEFKSLVLVSDNARIGRPKRKVDGLDDVIKAERLRSHLMEAFDKSPDYKMVGLLGKEGLEAFARDLAALHRPASWHWEARFGLSDATSSASLPAPPVVVTTSENEVPRRQWLVKYDGPCSRCGVMLAKGTPAVWKNAQRKMLCLDCGAL